MKVLCLVVLLCAVAINAKKEEKRQISALAALSPVISNFLLDKLHISDWIGKAIGSVTALFKGKSGDITVPNSTLKLHYRVEKCKLHFGKRFLIKNIVPHERCKATVSENAITKTSSSCEESHQDKALKCAMEAELKKIQALAEQAAKQEAGK
ncbi:hypothetical protein SNE40_007262 [Patella caerulea]|uniref:Uncharacterized protein n=1 Tax=Patella caerulea TaxID=87958 RepID=A0AAN8K393_PATCE